MNRKNVDELLDRCRKYEKHLQWISNRDSKEYEDLLKEYNMCFDLYIEAELNGSDW